MLDFVSDNTNISSAIQALEDVSSSFQKEQTCPDGVSELFLGKPQIEVKSEGVKISLDIGTIPVGNSVSFYIHWGCYDDASSWISEQVSEDELVANLNATFTVQKRIHPRQPGHYGVTCFALIDDEKHWFGNGQADDTKFVLESGVEPEQSSLNLKELADRVSFKARLLASFADYEKFLRFLTAAKKAKWNKGIGKLIYDLSKEDTDLERLLSFHFETALCELAGSVSVYRRKRLCNLLHVLENIGIGEVVFIAPEGPHAAAGGLSQVISGLTKSLDDAGLSATLISPLYEEAQGSKHQSAEQMLEKGLRLNGSFVPIELVGRLRIDLGPTYYSGSTDIKEASVAVSANVYKAERGNVRVFFLRHRKHAARLYPDSSGKEQLSHAAFFARGALEILRSPDFGINPHIVVTNDWPTALVPVFLKADPVYANDDILKKVQTFHILHNCGAAYQGRFFINQFGEDLWPLLKLSGSHFFGLCHPNDGRLLNLTVGAIRHVGRALVAVSKPYAEDLLTEQGGEGLHELLEQKADCVYGISNGVDLASLRHVFWELGEKARFDLGLSSLVPVKFRQARFIKSLSDYKQALKLAVQRKYGLNESDEGVLISFVGRLAEQKGVSLLTEFVRDSSVTLLETLLKNYPLVQIIIGGPLTTDYVGGARLEETIKSLVTRYPGRIKGIFDFVPHNDALEITAASDLFLMPSRYEPGGITQLEALATGTIVVARNVGGLTATLVNYSEALEEGNAFLFTEYSAGALFDAVSRAIDVLKNKHNRDNLVRVAAQADNDWTHRLPKYLAMFQYTSGVFHSDTVSLQFSGRKELLSSIRPSRVRPS